MEHTLEIIVQSYRDNRRISSKQQATKAVVFVDGQYVDGFYLPNEKYIEYELSAYEAEVFVIMKYLFEYLNEYEGRTIKCIGSERALRKIGKRLNVITEYLHTAQGQQDFAAFNIDDLLDHMIFDLGMLDPRSGTYEWMRDGLKKLIPMLVNKPRKVFEFDVYAAKTKHKNDDSVWREWQVAHDVREMVLRVADISMGFTPEQTMADIEKRRSTWTTRKTNKNR